MSKKEVIINGFKITYKDTDTMMKLFGKNLEEEAKKEKSKKKNDKKN